MTDIETSKTKTISLLVGQYLPGSPGEGLFCGQANVSGRIEQILLVPGMELLDMRIGGEPCTVGDSLQAGQEMLVSVRQARKDLFSIHPTVLLSTEFGSVLLGTLPVKRIEETLIKPGDIVCLSCPMPVAFRPTMLEIETDSEGDVFIQDIRFGKYTVLASESRLSVDTCRKLTDLKWPALQIGQVFKMVLKNDSTKKTRSVKVKLTGLVVE